jgi:hypothetical protein
MPEDVKRIEAYGIYDPKHGDLISLPGVDGYCRSTMPDLKLLLFCLGETKANVVKVTIEPVSGLVVSP